MRQKYRKSIKLSERKTKSLKRINTASHRHVFQRTMQSQIRRCKIVVVGGVSIYLLSSIHLIGNQVRASGFWDRGACRNWDILSTGSSWCRADHSPEPPRSSDRNCTEPETFESVPHVSAASCVACSPVTSPPSKQLVRPPWLAQFSYPPGDADRSRKRSARARSDQQVCRVRASLRFFPDVLRTRRLTCSP